MLAWMLYAVMVSALLSLGAFLAERAARLKRAGTRWIWITAILASLALPTLISSVAFELPNVLGEHVASKIVVLRQATTLTLSPAVWITGEPEPASWRVANDTIRNLWLGVSVAMLLALVASGVQLFIRKRRWQRDTVAGASVYVTPDIGPAVVGLLRPRIAVPRWVTHGAANASGGGHRARAVASRRTRSAAVHAARSPCWSSCRGTCRCGGSCGACVTPSKSIATRGYSMAGWTPLTTARR